MPHKLEYHHRMRPVIRPPVALFAVLAISLLIPAAYAQVNGAQSSVTSPGFGGRPVNGAPPSVTSLGPRGYAPAPQIPMASAANGFRHTGGQHRRRTSDAAPIYAFPVPYAVPVPYAPDDAVNENSDADDNDPNYQGGPTVFDRRGYGESSYIPPVSNATPAHADGPYDSADAEPEPEAPQVSTILVFKDGHQLEVGNYAIVGQTLFDLTPGHARRIELAALDLDATQKQNDNRGVTFQLPQSQPISQPNSNAN